MGQRLLIVKRKEWQDIYGVSTVMTLYFFKQSGVSGSGLYLSFRKDKNVFEPVGTHTAFIFCRNTLD